MANIGTNYTFDMSEGNSVTLETGKLAKQSDGSIVLKHKNMMLLATVVASRNASTMDYFPLSVDYKEKYSAAGKFPGGFFKREARPTDNEILTSRLIDRVLRPLFPKDFMCETQVLVSLISHDKDVMPDGLACLAASTALMCSDIPFSGPVSEVRVARINGQLTINPSKEELDSADIDMIIGGTLKDIVMVEGEMDEISEEEMLEAIKFAHEAIKIQCSAQIELAKTIEKATVKRDFAVADVDQPLFDALKSACYDKCYEIAKEGSSKAERSVKFTAVKEAFVASLSAEEAAEKKGLISEYFHDVNKDAVRTMVLTERTRLDGRKTDEIRAIWGEVNYLPGAHGSAIFTRGETQALASVTLGNKMDEQIVDSVTSSSREKFMLHYNFPPFSTGEARFLRGTSRREIGHGNLALRALKRMIPADSAYTIRILSDILESNGSSSMATVCAGTMSLMDAGIQIKKPVSGIAMGLISDGKGNNAVLSDILGDEDHLGDMDFKVTGTRDGITACQMDIKIDGLPYDVMTEALMQARAGRLHILGEIDKVISSPNSEIKDHAPRIVKLEIPKDMIGAVIGPGGKVIQELQAETGASIVIDEVDGVGIVDVFSDNKESLEAALAKIKLIVSVPEIGEVYKGKVKSIMPYGAFVEILPGKDGLLHISEIDHKRLETVESVLKEGEIVEVKIIDIDSKSGKLKLSRKVLLDKQEETAAPVQE
ncbi:MAG: polyribonucleotide nucleotidyltransferase [Flavobacteriales bacterium]|nr:polyribonucleotide nucleotidyltransferase [Flavobacteriales bacterium]